MDGDGPDGIRRGRTTRGDQTPNRPCSTMTTLSPDDRPREKLARHGAAALGDNELVALILGSGSGRAGALDVSNDLLRARGGLHGLARSTGDELARVRGIGAAR